MNTTTELLRPSLRAKLNNYLDKSKPKAVAATSTHYAEWLGGIEWTFFCTFTTPYEMTLNTARRLMERYHKKLRENGLYATFFWVAEKFEVKDGYHTHGLMSVKCSDDFKPLARQLAFETWQKVSVTPGQTSNRPDSQVFNRCDIQPIRPSGKACKYVSAYVGKRKTDYDIYFN